MYLPNFKSKDKGALYYVRHMTALASATIIVGGFGYLLGSGLYGKYFWPDRNENQVLEGTVSNVIRTPPGDTFFQLRGIDGVIGFDSPKEDILTGNHVKIVGNPRWSIMGDAVWKGKSIEKLDNLK